MKKKYLVFGLLAAGLSGAHAQGTDSVYVKKKVAKTDVQVLFSFYGQEGVHSAVTGGIGTERLQVYAPEVSVEHDFDSIHVVRVRAGVDIITSASTDKIDFAVSSASRKDAHTYLNLGYEQRLPRHRLALSGRTGLSIESDYSSVSGGLGLSHSNASRTREWSASVDAFFDDLRWGRLNPTYRRPVRLIYPQELRGKIWYEVYLRQSVNLSFSLYQVINRRMTMAFFPEIGYQQGLLATPFHRVYFNDGQTLRVENLPRQRWKVPLGVQANVFAGRKMVIRSYYRWYWDTFGIRAHTFSVEMPLKALPSFTITPQARLYAQRASRYFQPYAGHDPAATFYTSDYDLSRFWSFSAGLGFRLAPYKHFWRYASWDAVALRYSYYRRSDGLSSHSVTLMWDLGREKSRRKV